MTRTFTLPIAALAALMCSIGHDVNAQTLSRPQPRPPQGAFDQGEPSDTQLRANLSLITAYDDSLTALEGQAPDPRVQQSGTFDTLMGGGQFSKRLQKVTFALNGESVLRYYPSLSDIASVQHSASAAANITIGRGSLRLTEGIGVMPYFSVSTQPRLIDPGLAPLPASVGDQATMAREQRTSSSAIDATIPLGRGTTFALTSLYETSDFVNETSGRRTLTAGGNLTRRLNRDVSLVAGYTYQDAEYRVPVGPAQLTVLHNINLGLDYNRALGATRRTTVGFTTGTAAAQYQGVDTQFLLTIDARLNREIGRSWHSTAAYRRGVEFVDGFAAPFFADTLSVDTGGMLSRTVDLSMVGAYSKGQIGLVRVDSHTQTYTGSVRVRRAFSRSASLRVEYLIYQYEFDQATALPVGLPPHLFRQGARVGFDLSLPFLR